MGRITPVCFAVLALLAAGLPASAQQPAQPTQPQQQTQQQPAQPVQQQAQPPPPPPAIALPAEVLEPIKRFSESIETAEKSIQQLKELEGELQRLRGDVERIIYESTAAAEGLRPQLAEVRGQIEKLGPPPGAGQPQESPTVAAERARLNALAAALDGAVKTSELAWVRAKQLIDRITVMRYQLFTRNLFERRDSPLLPGLWRDVSSRTGTVLGRVHYYGGDWLGWAGRKSAELALLALGLIGLLGGAWFLHQRHLAHHLARPEHPPDFFSRAVNAAWRVPLRLAAPVAAAVLAYSVLDGLDLLYAPWDGLGNALFKGALLLSGAVSLASVVLSPRQPWWRLVPVADATARRLLFFIAAFVSVFVLDAILVELGRIVYVPLTMTIAQAFISSVLFAGLLAGLLLTPFEPQSGADRPVNGDHAAPVGPVSRHRPLWLKLPLWLIALLIVGSAMLGYIALSRFVSFQLVMSGVVLTTVGLIYLAIRAVTRGRADGRHVLGEALAARYGLERSRLTQLSRLVEFALTCGLVTLALPVLMLQWGFSGAEIRDWSKALLFGFEVGQFRISLARILIGIALFIGLLFLTRIVQRWLRERVLAQPRMDSGIANSIDTAVGYGGIALAALLAVSYAGFDVTNLAIVAGALSVGIGFGLQSIVNNFVSGLILLIERPIKVGDWIVVGNEQGNVRRISVRSTEIETFDRASLIVPNSELIAGRVFNWTHRNLLGRIIIKVSTDASADPELVIRLLQEAAAAHKDVIRQPEPMATLDTFGPDKLDFTIRATLGDVNKGGRTQSDLKVAILRSFRQNGLIVIAAPAASPPLAQTADARKPLVAPLTGTRLEPAAAMKPERSS